MITNIVLGIDGATFDLFEEWLPDLPTISSIIEEGISSELESSIPPVTSPAWRCYATGKDPSKLGIYWWRQLDRETNAYKGAPSIPLRSKCYWEYLSEWGDDVAVLGVPLNTPPREVNGKLILGGPYADQNSYTYPDDLQETLETRFNYKLHPTTDPASADEPTSQDIVEDLESMIHQRFDVAEWMLEDDPDLLNITLFYINHLQHMAWKAPEVKQLWEVIDDRLGQLLEEQHNIIIHSDHGLHEVHSVFYLNSWLESEGYLSLKRDPRSSSHRIQHSVKKALSRVVTQPSLEKHLPEAIIDKLSIPSSGRIVDASEYETRIDFAESTAVGLPHGLIYILTEDRDSVAKELRTKLEQVNIPDSRESAFECVKPLKEEYSSWDERESPDLFVKWKSGIEVKDVNIENPSRQFGPPQQFKADNAPNGILLAAGPELGGNEVQGDAELYDLAPTLLHLMGHPVPSDMDGGVLQEIYAPNTAPSQRDVTETEGSIVKTSSQDYDSNVEDRLKELGYLE